jgi:hypothetical protein
MTAENVRAIIAPITAMGIIFGGGAFLFFTLGVEGARVESVHLIISGLMGGAAQFLFGDAVQRRTNEGQPTVVTTAGPPPTTTVTPAGNGAEGVG